MILGLLKPDRGTIELLGRRVRSGKMDALRRIGSLVEAPPLYLRLTARENLEVHRLLLDLPGRAVDEALDMVDLRSAATPLVCGYSSGMKQRLGLAQALLGQPELLLLDEATNALDPAGIHEIRNLIKDLPTRRRMTVFLSSHQLAKVEHTETHVAIIAGGVLKFEDTTAVALGLAALSTSILVAGVIASGLILPHLQQTATFNTPMPALAIVTEGFQMTSLGFLALSIQDWVSLRWRAFAGSTGIGIVAMLLGYGMVAASQPNGGWTQWFPWSLPMLTLAAWPVHVPFV